MCAEQQHTVAFSERGIEMLAPDDRNIRPDLVIGRFHRNSDLYTSAQKITQRLARNTVDLTGTQAIAQSNANIGDGTSTKAAKQIKADLGQRI